MEHTHHELGAPAANNSQMNLGEPQIKHATAKHKSSHLPPAVTHGHYPAALSHAFSPSQDRFSQEAALPGHHGDAIPSRAQHHHPPTPPRQEDELDELLRWRVMQHGQHGPLHQTASNTGIDDAAHQYSHARSLSTPQLWRPSASIGMYSPGNYQAYSHQTRPYEMEHYQNHQPPSYSQTDSHAEDDVSQARREFARLTAQLSRMEPQVQLHAAKPQPHIPPSGSDWTPSHLPLYHDDLQLPQPPVQQWPTHSLGQQFPPPLTPPRQRARTLSATIAIGPSPGHDGVTPPDKVALKKAEALRKKAEELRQRRQSIAGPMAPPSAPPAKGKGRGRKRKLSLKTQKESVPTIPPNLRRAFDAPHGLPHYGQPGDVHEPGQHNGYMLPYELSQAESRYMNTLQPPVYQQPEARPEYGNYSHVPALAPRLDVPLRAQSIYTPKPWYHGYIRHEDPRPQFPGLQTMPAANPPVSPRVPSKPEPIDWDTKPQAITREYEDYRWSITLYDVSSNSGFDFAQPWLEELFTTNNLNPPDYKWHAHSTRGFIHNGTRMSIIVLHNAADPFEWGLPPTSTTSIGVYGRHWHEHEEIHWKTFAPDIKWLLDAAEQQGCISITQQWKFDMPKASERRFHKAYYMAATMGPIKDLLKHREVSDPVHDAVEEEDQGFEVSEEDLQGGEDWDNTEEESTEAWKRVLERNEDVADVLDGTSGFEHVVTGSSELDDL